MNKINSESRNKTIVLLLIVGALIYSQTLNYSFLHWDDDAHILSHPPLTWATLVSVFTQPYYGLFIPVTYFLWGCISLALSWFHIPPHPFPFHALNLLLHLLNSVQVYSLIKLVGLDTRADKFKGPRTNGAGEPAGFSSGAAQVGALLFLLHPLQVGGVAWISGGRDLLSSAFGLWATRVYINSGRKMLPTILYGLGLLSKPSLIFLPLGLLALQPEKAKKSIPWLILCSILGGFILFWTRAAQSYSLMPSVAWFRRPLVAIDSLGFYLRKIIFPYPLSVDYGRTPEWVLQNNSFLLSGACLLAFVGMLGVFRPFLPSAVKKGLGWSFFLILPVLGWIPSAQQSISTVPH
ncbi:MAG: hypothetical protein ABI041_02140 [Bdellovibrionia bacterium]